MNRVPLESHRSCQFCHCREDRACIVDGVPCHWVGPRLCSNPRCMDAAKVAAIGGRRKFRGNARHVTKDGRLIHRSPWAWLQQRKRVWERDGGRCVALRDGRPCGAEVTLQEACTHHRRRRGMGGGFRDDRDENLETNCLACHMREHDQALWEAAWQAQSA